MKQRVVGSIVLLLLTLGWGSRGVGEQGPAPRGELRIVDTNPRTGRRLPGRLRAPHRVRQGWQVSTETGHWVAVAG